MTGCILHESAPAFGCKACDTKQSKPSQAGALAKDAGVPLHNGYLEWKDGRREPTNAAGGLWIIMLWKSTGGRLVEITFEAKRMTDDGLPVYVEGETKDVSARYRESEARHMVERAFERGVALPGYVLQGRHLGETDEEFARRVEILRPAAR